MGEVLPIVRLLIPCDNVLVDFRDMSWELKNPWGTRQLSAGSTFPFRERDIWIFAQLVEGIGDIELMVEMNQLLEGGRRRFVGNSNAELIRFRADDRLIVWTTAFHMKFVPFRRAGLYEFRVTSKGRELTGYRAEIRMLDRSQI